MPTSRKNPATQAKMAEMEKELEELRAMREKLGPLLSLMSPAQKPEDNPALTPKLPGEVLRFPVDLDGTIVAEYEHVGECMHPGCALKVFKCNSHPVRADNMVGTQLAVFVPGATNKPPMTYCQAHDPNRKHKFVRRPMAKNGDFIGDHWTPRAVQNTIGL